MADISAVGAGPMGRVGGVDATPSRRVVEVASPEVRRGTDRVELSEMATYMSKLKQLPPTRQALIDSIKGEIASGTYDTPEKLDAALDQMLGEEGVH